MTGNTNQRSNMDSLKGTNPKRIGQLGNAKSVWDNGLYAEGVIGGVTVDFLVDSGSTATLLSKQAFDKMAPGSIDLQQKSIVMQSVDGKTLRSMGLQKSISLLMIVICDILLLYVTLHLKAYWAKTFY